MHGWDVNRDGTETRRVSERNPDYTENSKCHKQSDRLKVGRDCEANFREKNLKSELF